MDLSTSFSPGPSVCVITAKAAAQALALCPRWQSYMDPPVVVAHARTPHPVFIALFRAFP